MTKSGKLTADKIYSRLAKKYPPPAYVMLPQVRNGTGFSRRMTRTADAICASVWPSNGLYLTGFEIKVSAADWRNELKDPGKAEAIQRYCRYWYVVAPKDVVPIEEVPDAWGLIECSAKQTRATRAAPANGDALPPDVLLLCAILRAASESSVPRCEINDRIELAQKKSAEHALQSQQYSINRLQDRIKRFEERSGIKIDEWQAGDVGEAVRFLQRTGVHKAEERAQMFRNQLQGVLDQLDKSLERLRNNNNELR